MSATPSTITFVARPGTANDPEVVDIYFRGVTPLNPGNLVNGTPYDIWCLNEAITLPPNATYTSYLYSSYEIATLSAIPGLPKTKLDNLDNINWLINNYKALGANYADTQGAIWKMIGSAKYLVTYLPQDSAKIDALVAAAMQHDGYKPGEGEMIGMIVDPMTGTTHRQPIIVAVQSASLGDRVWHDANANGLQDAGETGIAGAVVNLVRDQNGDGDFLDAGEQLGTTTTDASGNYKFIGLTPALSYRVQFSLPAGYERISPRQSDGSAASGANSDASLSSVVVLAPGEKNTSIDAGFYNTASLGDRVWLDANANGQQDSGEAGVGNVKVTLVGGGADGKLSTTADNTSVSTTTDASGNYTFTGLMPGAEYQVQFDKPAGSVFTRPDTGSDVSDSDAGTGGLSQVVVLASGENNTTIDAGIYLPASLGDRVWLDANGNGQQDSGEAGVAGAKVTLVGGGADGMLATTGDNTSVDTTTDANGNYKFDGLTPGAEYQVQFTAPDGSVFTRANSGNDVSDSDAAAGGLSQVVVLGSGENNTTIDAGVYAPASLGDRVWVDANGNGQQDGGEAGVANTKVTLVGGGADGLISTAGDNTSVDTTTDADGNYKFGSLTPGVEYQVQFTAPSGSVFTGANVGNDASDSDADASGMSQVVVLASGENNTTIDAGIHVPASLGDRVWLDANANGQQDSGETGIGGVKVTLLGGGADGLLSTTGDNTSVSTATGANGDYRFDGLTPGVEYQVQFDTPAGFVASASDVGNDASDSDAGIGGLSQVVTLTSGEHNPTIDAGFYQTASLGDRVWLDANGNGQQDSGEAGVANTKVTLIGGGADGLLSTTGDNTSIDTTTDADGNYKFAGLTPGVEYQVQFTAPAGSVFTGANVGNDVSDSDAGVNGLSQVVTLTSGENNTTIDAGVYVPASLGDRVWVDANGNGQQDGGEAGVANAKVTLTSGGADGKLSTTGDNTSVDTTTDADGNYAFAGLTPGVEYQVQFTAPAGSVFTAANVGNDLSDSDAGVNGLSQVVTLTSGENNTTIDAGVYVPASLGDRVWVDANGNGQQDSGEAGVVNAKVTLIGGGADGKLSTLGDNTSVDTTTDADGNYKFTGLTPGVEYQVQFTAPSGSVFTGANVGNDVNDSDAGVNGLSQVVTLTSGENNTTIDAGVYVPASLGDRVWVDANGNGQQDSGEAGVANAKVTLIGGGADGKLSTTGDNTSVDTTTDADGNYKFAGLTPGVEYQVQFTVPSGSVFTAANVGNDLSDSDAGVNGKSQVVTLAAGENNTSIDAGIYAPASLGDRVWADANGNGIQDAGEANVAGVVVNLLDGAGATIATRTTGQDGLYLFDNLAPGSYRVGVNLASLPAGYTATTKNASGSTALNDSDADPVTGLMAMTELVSGEADRSWDVGIKARSIGIDIEKLVHVEYVTPAASAPAEGLTPGFWKNHTGAGGAPLSGWPQTGLVPSASYEALFGVDVPGSAPTLLQALGAEGGGVEALLRHSAAALLNASNPYITYAYTAAQVISMVKTAFATGDYEMTKNLLAKQNELGANLVDLAPTATTVVTSDVDADTSGSGPTSPVGGTAVFTYIVKNTGSVELGNVNVVDDRVSGLSFVGGDTDGDGLLDVTETWTYKASEPVASTAERSSTGTVTGKDMVTHATVSDADATYYNGSAPGQTIGDRLWLDNNGNGVQDAGEAGIAGATVQLKNGSGSVLQTVTTDVNGYYLFKVTPGSYSVTFQAPTGYVATAKDAGANDASDSDIDAATRSTDLFTIVSGQQKLTVDAGMYQTASLGDRLWIDANANGLQDSGETGLAGQTVTLLGGGADGLLSTTLDNTSVTTVTGTDGVYNFGNLTPGVQYQVKFSKPTGYIFASQDTGGNDALDSDVNASSGLTQIVTLQSGETNKTLDAGLVSVAGDLSITKTDGLTYVTPGQTITYKIVVTNTGTAVAANALVTDAIPSTLTNVTWTSSATAGASGNELSGSGGINDYVTLNGGSSITYTITAKVAALSALETVSDFSTLGNNIGVGAVKTVNGVTADAAYISAGVIGSATLWARNSGDDKGVGVLSRYEDAAGGEAVTGLSNQKNTDVIRLTKTDGDLWSSLWVSNLDAAGSGGAEIGTLYWSDNPVPDLATLTTKFTFRYGDFGVGAEAGDVLTLRPATFDAGAKYVFFVAGSNPSGSNNDFLVWKAGTVPEQIVNTAKVAAPSTFVDTNSSNNSATDIDGIKLPTPVAVKRGSIGDTVWEDSNYNGVRDTGEAGIRNVTVRLLDSTGKVLETTVTNTSGNYLFDNLNAGSYRIEVVEPDSYFVTRQNVGSNDAIDSDIDTVAGRSSLIDLSQGENDLTWDAGLYRKASLGDKVWEDSDHDDIQDAGEAGIPGVKVQLYSAAGVLLASTTTNSTGNYKFSNLDPGTYFLKFDKNDVIYKGINMDNWMWASKNIGSNDAIDSDVTGDGVAKTNLTRTDNITLSSGENDMSWDAAITPIAIDLNGDGVHTVARSASSATFDLLGNGRAIQSGWLSADDGFLAVDVNGNGSIDGIAELFGGAAKGDGFSQLASYDSNLDGVVDARDAAFGELLIWQDANGNHQTDAGELLSLAAAGVVSLKVAYVELPFVDAQGNLHLERSSAVLANGTVADMTDVYFSIDARDAADVGAPTLADLLASLETDPAVPVAVVGQPPLVV